MLAFKEKDYLYSELYKLSLVSYPINKIMFLLSQLRLLNLHLCGVEDKDTLALKDTKNDE